MASQFADNAVYEFRARAGSHSQILPVVQGTNDSVFEFNHDVVSNSENPFDN